jgi:hypothetical protein
MRSKILSSVALAASMALAIGTSAHAAALITNGSFEQNTIAGGAHNAQFGSGAGQGGQTVTGWTGGSGYQIYFVGGTESTVNATGEYSSSGKEKLWLPATGNPAGGNFIALDGDQGGGSQANVQGWVSQDVDGLVEGQRYALTFDWAAAQLQSRTGATTEQLQVSFGGDTQWTSILSNPNEGFSGWNQVTMYFTANDASQTLKFLSFGTPSGLPPIALLDGVSLTAVPEPATWVMMLLGFGGLGAMIRRRNRSVIAAA